MLSLHLFLSGTHNEIVGKHSIVCKGFAKAK